MMGRGHRNIILIAPGRPGRPHREWLVLLNVHGKASKDGGWIEYHGKRDYRAFAYPGGIDGTEVPGVRCSTLEDAAASIATRLHPWRRRWDLMLPGNPLLKLR